MDIHKNARLTLRSREALAQNVSRTSSDAEARPRPPSGHPQDRRQVGAPLSGQGAGRFMRPLLATASQSARNFACRGRSRHRAAPSAYSRLSDRARTGLSPASISRILRRVRLSRWRDLHPAPPVVRYEHPAPGDLLHLDIKGLTRFQQVSWRADGRRRGLHKHPGCEALHVAIDDHSRLAFTQMLPDQKTDTTIAFLAMPSTSSLATASACALCSPTTAAAIAPTSSAMLATSSASNTAVPAPTRPAPTARPNASSRPLCANGPTPLTGTTPTNATAPPSLDPLLQPRPTPW